MLAGRGSTSRFEGPVAFSTVACGDTSSETPSAAPRIASTEPRNPNTRASTRSRSPGRQVTTASLPTLKASAQRGCAGASCGRHMAQLAPSSARTPPPNPGELPLRQPVRPYMPSIYSRSTFPPYPTSKQSCPLHSFRMSPSLRTAILFLSGLALMTPLSLQAQTAAQPPAAKKIHTEKPVNGDTLVDDYAWLRNKPDPEVAKYLEVENAYADSVMKPTEMLQKKLYDEMVSHIKETDDSVPHKQGDYFYYSRTEKGKQYAIVCRKHLSLDAPEQVMLDINKLAEGEKFMSLGALQVSDDGNLLAYSTDNTGFRQYRLHVRDLRNGQDLTDTAEKTGSLAWAADNKTLFYTVEDSAKRQYRLYRHTLGDPAASDALVYEEKDERFNVDVQRTTSRKLILLGIASHITSEFRFLDASAPTGEFKMIEPRRDGVEYYPDHRATETGGHFLIRINDQGPNFRLVSAKVSDPGKSHWVEVVPTRPDVMLEDVVTLDKFYVLYERDKGLPVFRVGHYGTDHYDTISFPESTYTASPRDNTDYFD